MKGQDDTDYKKWAIGITLSPDLCYRKLVKNSGDPSLPPLIQSRNKNEIIKLGYTAGIAIHYHLKSNLFLESGLQYATRGQRTKKLPVFFVASGSNDPINVRYNYYFNYLELPLKINRTFDRGNHLLYISGGLITGYLWQAGVVTKVGYSGGNKEKTKQPNTFYNYNKLSFSPTLGIGLCYQLTEKLSIKAGPEYRIAVRSIINAPLKGYLWSIGLNACCYLNL